ncbi:MAG: YidC/Oxa1 family membrane protein insertase [Coriobacteriales bacterium]|nr:YidC/Oxa1 family membrane protein insertase [Coriobacteriales bacterium]
MWNAFIDFLTNILTGLYNFSGDWGMAIIILTLIIRLLLTPLMVRSTRSSAKMQVLQPKMQELQERYADDPQQLQQEMSKLYAENKFNPLGGCLPIFLQMPVFFALFSVISSVAKISKGTPSFYNIVPDLSVGPAQVIAEKGWEAAIVYILLDVLFGALTLIPLLLNTRTTTDPTQARTSKMMGIFMSVWMVWIGWGLPSGVLLYYNTSALWQVAQQQFVTKRVLDAAKAEEEAKMANAPIQVDVVRKESRKRPHKKS